MSKRLDWRFFVAVGNPEAVQTLASVRPRRLPPKPDHLTFVYNLAEVTAFDQLPAETVPRAYFAWQRGSVDAVHETGRYERERHVCSVFRKVRACDCHRPPYWWLKIQSATEEVHQFELCLTGRVRTPASQDDQKDTLKAIKTMMSWSLEKLIEQSGHYRFG